MREGRIIALFVCNSRFQIHCCAREGDTPLIRVKGEYAIWPCKKEREAKVRDFGHAVTRRALFLPETDRYSYYQTRVLWIFASGIDPLFICKEDFHRTNRMAGRFW